VCTASRPTNMSGSENLEAVRAGQIVSLTRANPLYKIRDLAQMSNRDKKGRELSREKIPMLLLGESFAVGG